MLCVACMILAYVFAVKIAIALLLMSRSKKMPESIRTRVLRRFDFIIWIVYALYFFLCSMYDIGICLWCRLCDRPPSHF